MNLNDLMTSGGGVRRGGLMPQQEYLLQGSILDSSCEVLLHRLRGLCDNADTPPEKFQDHEMVYTIRTPQGSSLTLRVREDIPVRDSMNPKLPPKYPFHLRYLGQPELGNRPTVVRSCIDVACSNNICQFLSEMGFKMDYDFLSKGYMFKKGRMKVIVAKIFRIIQPGNMDNVEMLSQSYLVELSVVAPSGQEGLADEVRSFADQLKPLVVLEKIDHRRLQQQTQ